MTENTEISDFSPRLVQAEGPGISTLPDHLLRNKNKIPLSPDYLAYCDFVKSRRNPLAIIKYEFEPLWKGLKKGVNDLLKSRK